MRPTTLLAAVLLAAAGPSHGQFPEKVSFTTVSITPLAIEGLTSDDNGALYTTGRAAAPTRCPVWRIDADPRGAPVSPVQVGSIPNAAACNPSGIARDSSGNFYIA